MVSELVREVGRARYMSLHYPCNTDYIWKLF